MSTTYCTKNSKVKIVVTH